MRGLWGWDICISVQLKLPVQSSGRVRQENFTGRLFLFCMFHARSWSAPNTANPRTRRILERSPWCERLGPFEKLLNNVVYLVRMGNRAHVAKILELHYLDLWQCGRKQPCHPYAGPRCSRLNGCRRPRNRFLPRERRAQADGYAFSSCGPAEASRPGCDSGDIAHRTAR
jgi:hypothetical protein